MTKTSAALWRLARYGPAFIVAFALFLCWELYVRLTHLSPLILPTPTAVLSALVGNWDVIAGHTLQTLVETVLGMVAATLLGLFLAILLDITPWVRKAVYPILVTSQTIPMIALAPLLLLWMGFEIQSKIVVVILYCFFPIAVASADGLASAEIEMLRLLKSMRASRWQTLWLVRLPGALPSFFSGLRIAVTYSVTGAIFGEYIGAEKGLGVYMQLSFNSRAVVLVFAAIVVTSVLSLLLFGLVSLMERIALPWYYASSRSF